MMFESLYNIPLPKLYDKYEVEMAIESFNRELFELPQIDFEEFKLYMSKSKKHNRNGANKE